MHGCHSSGLLSLGIKEGDEVIVPDLTWVVNELQSHILEQRLFLLMLTSTLGALHLKLIERCISSKTKAVVVVDLLGNIPDMDPIVDICRQRGLYLIEDAAEGIGATYKDSKLVNLAT